MLDRGMGCSHGKIILMGEHSVVYGYSAIALPLLGIEAICRIQPASQVLTFDFEDSLSTAIFAALSSLNQLEAKISFKVASKVPQKRGMGSSAAVSIAAIRAVYAYFEESLSEETLEQLVHQAEKIAHSNPSGLDAKTCLSDTPIKFSRDTGFDRLEVALDAYLVIADSGIQGHTREAVNKVARFEETNRPHLVTLGRLAEQAEAAIQLHQSREVGRLMNLAHKELMAIGVSLPFVDELVQEARVAGALGAKMSGGGLGGCVIALAANLEDARVIREKLFEKGAQQIWIEKV